MFDIFFFTYSIVLSIPAFIFSILSWRLRTDVMFWLGVVFTSFLVLYTFVKIELVLYLILNIDTFLYGLIILAFIGIPVYFLISSKLSKPGNGDTDVTDDYLTRIIESDDEDIDYEN
ncbi:MAG: hypothetical protein HYZ14_11340 [Bacteroidetes bacterium]|nr:hypothetical protein [Bacteroidota bacterium]